MIIKTMLVGFGFLSALSAFANSDCPDLRGTYSGCLEQTIGAGVQPATDDHYKIDEGIDSQGHVLKYTILNFHLQGASDQSLDYIPDGVKRRYDTPATPDTYFSSTCKNSAFIATWDDMLGFSNSYYYTVHDGTLTIGVNDPKDTSIVCHQ